MTKLKILVIDDSPIHQQAARQQLGEAHNLTVVGSYDEARNLLGGGRDWKEQHGFDAVLCDLLMPADSYMQGDKGASFVGQEMPIGIFLAILAAKNGARYVAVFSDSSHHEHPASACVDDFNAKKNWENHPAIMKMCGADVVLTNNRQWIRDGKKQWHKVLEHLTSPPGDKPVRIA